MIQQLNGEWTVLGGLADGLKAYGVPFSLYSVLSDSGKIPDPYFGETSAEILRLSEEDYVFEHTFEAEKGILGCEKIYLRFNGIDTIAEIELNGTAVGSAGNMHRTYEYDVTRVLRSGKNLLRVKMFSPLAYIRAMQRLRPLWGVNSTEEGFPHLRKAHYMFGWDWCPELPDMGIWRSVELVGVKKGRIESVNVTQNHLPGSVRLSFDTLLTDISSSNLSVSIILTSPEGAETHISSAADSAEIRSECTVNLPLLWNVRGYGKQNLYMVKVTLYDGTEPVDVKEFNIGLRKITVCRNPDRYGGEEFCFSVNGIKIFAMGANYVPEDNILPRRSAERTRELLKSFAAANFNMVRVWGGGFYPDDYFYDMCDRLGILVWQDFAFGCALYDPNENFCESVRAELADNIKRIRNHASLAMWCGNNEIESAILYWGIPVTEKDKQDYVTLFSHTVYDAVKEYDPYTYYWSSTPSSGGQFSNPANPDKGDSHYWAMWHNFADISDFRSNLFRFCSEYGFESLPSIKTVSRFAEKKDMNLCSAVMEAHQKCENGNEKLLYYIARTTHLPNSFEGMIYATQLIQADRIRLCAEHLRRNRGVCMGSLYWQANDSNPAVSWSSVDYYGRWKALHYFAKKFYAPVLCSADDSDPEHIILNVSNERLEGFSGTLRWRVRKNDTTVISQGETDVSVPPQTAANVLSLTPNLTKLSPPLYRKAYIEYSLSRNNTSVSSGTVMLVPPKHFEFLDPEIKCHVGKVGDMFCFELSSRNFAKGVQLDFDDCDCVFSDNWFNLHGKIHTVLVNAGSFADRITPQELERKLRIRSYYDITK